MIIETDDSATPTNHGKQLFFVIGLFVLALVVVAGAGVLGYRWFLMPTTADGTCSVFDNNQCSALSDSRVEQAADVDIPAGATIIDSGASRSLKAGYQSALIQLPSNEKLGLGAGYVEALVGDETLDVSSYLAENDLSEIDSIEVNPERGSTVYLAHDDDGRRWAYVKVVWNG